MGTKIVATTLARQSFYMSGKEWLEWTRLAGRGAKRLPPVWTISARRPMAKEACPAVGRGLGENTATMAKFAMQFPSVSRQLTAIIKNRIFGMPRIGVSCVIQCYDSHVGVHHTLHLIDMPDISQRRPTWHAVVNRQPQPIG